MIQKPVSISVILPVLNEAENLPCALQALGGDGDCQIIVVDGGSADETMRAARDLGAAVISSAPGRGQQIVRGVAEATGDILLFLHADTRLGPNALMAIRKCLGNEGVVGGNFALTFDGGTGFARWLTGFYAKIRRHGLYYGDSAIFVRRSVYNRIGGMRPLSLMEDYDFVRRMEAAGHTVCLSRPGAMTSSRRFEGRRPWRIFAQWVWIHALFALGVSTERLSRIYRSDQHRPAAGA